MRNGGTASGTVVYGGGTQYAFSGGVASATTIQGGFVWLLSGGGIGGAPIGFAGGGTLRLDDAVDFAGTISGFGVPDQLDLRDIPFGAGSTVNFAEAASNLSGTLSVSGGGISAGITLLGSYTPGQFNIADDGAGGTLVTDPPVSATSTTDASFNFADVSAPGPTTSTARSLPFDGSQGPPSGSLLTLVDPAHAAPAAGLGYLSGSG